MKITEKQLASKNNSQQSVAILRNVNQFNHYESHKNDISLFLTNRKNGMYSDIS